MGRKSHHRNGPMIAKPDHKSSSSSGESPIGSGLLGYPKQSATVSVGSVLI
jgi:hypothetical protein